jgi:RHH-type rel operon transcriptional repressor/antitoxin RelB
MQVLCFETIMAHELCAGYYQEGGKYMSSAISVSIPDNLVRGLEHVAKETERSRSFHIQQAIEAYLEEYAELQIAFERLHEASDPIISLDTMRQQLGL